MFVFFVGVQNFDVPNSTDHRQLMHLLFCFFASARHIFVMASSILNCDGCGICLSVHHNGRARPLTDQVLTQTLQVVVINRPSFNATRFHLSLRVFIFNLRTKHNWWELVQIGSWMMLESITAMMLGPVVL